MVSTFKEIHRLSNLNGDGVAVLKEKLESLSVDIQNKSSTANFV